MTRVVALGGNALARRGEPITAAVQRRNVELAAEALAPLLDSDESLVITHGNGPQVGMLMLESEADTVVGAYPLDVLGAETEGMIGYMLEQALIRRAPHARFATLLTQTVVSAADPAMRKPTKPVGPVYDTVTAHRLAEQRGFSIAPDTGGWRRVVPSPEPIRILEQDAVRVLLDNGTTVITAGGGGVPVVIDDQGRPSGVEGVVDKDLTAVVLALAVGADSLVLLTDVDGVYRDFSGPRPEKIEHLTARTARALISGGAVGHGSMGPKLEAAARFADQGGTAVIAALDQVAGALAGEAGTTIAPDGSHTIFDLERYRTAGAR
jgi:carbamate kinase